MGERAYIVTQSIKKLKKEEKLYKINVSLIYNHAADRNRTGTGITTHGILSPGRLPVPPLRHMEPIGLEPMTLCL